jgi:pimeloyl-ACP methyl ester carboxylesterase
MTNETLRLRTNGIELDAGAAGPAEGPMVILLHGFPEVSYGWHRQIGALAAAGLRVLAPDQRGYNRSSKPAGIAAYTLDSLADDVIGLADALGRDRFAVVGHDWGGVVAWRLAARNPERVIRAAILNAPHPATLRRYARAHPSQAMKSWYVSFFQLPSVSFFQLPSVPERVPGRIRVPVRVIWGDRDAFLDRGLAKAGASLCDDAEIIRLAEATHWLQHEEPDAVNRLLIDFLA